VIEIIAANYSIAFDVFEFVADLHIGTNCLQARKPMTARKIPRVYEPINVDDIEAAFQKIAGNRSKLLYMCGRNHSWDFLTVQQAILQG
jgi:hypothetical protein